MRVLLMKKHFSMCIAVCLVGMWLLDWNTRAADMPHPDSALARRIVADERLDKVDDMALKLLNDFNAGTSYGEIWIRDFNTFINGSLRVHSKEEVKERLLLFFRIQGKDGNVPDGAIKSEKANVGYQYTYSDLAPGWAAHKNTVETDQESSLIQAVAKYIRTTGDKEIFNEKIGDKTVLERMDAALSYVLTRRWSTNYGLVTGGTTVDWGDMQAQEGWGVAINDKTKWAIDIYDNAMFLMAIDDFVSMAPKGYRSAINWTKTAAKLKTNIRHYLWDAKAQKYVPHIYLNGSPFKADFDESKILYTGGSACAILAGLNNRKEISNINRQFLAAAAQEKYATIGVTVYPPYPLEAFPNVPPYTYQNAGDWAWFGARMVQALVANEFVDRGYAELSPMLDRVLKDNGFFEWYDVRTGEPKGSGNFRGAAGVLHDAIQQLRQWAQARRDASK